MRLSKENLKKISSLPGLSVPDEKIIDLPEKVLQFGTGVLLRGLPDYFIDKANKQGIFNGRIVVVKSTAKGDADAFDQQDGLYTLCVKGIEENRNVEETIVNASISRVLAANQEWKEILQCAHNPAIGLIISNTTEVGIVLTDDDIHQSPPSSFPGKLLAFLYERYKITGGDVSAGFVIIPTELIVDNGAKLRTIVIELAKKNELDDTFLKWLHTANHFCSSLVDRIVPGKLPATDKMAMQEKLGYEDELMIMAESFRLWAIESSMENAQLQNMLSFRKADEGVVVASDIGKFRELKLRLLNGTHSFCCGIALLAGFKTVKEAMDHEQMLAYVKELMLEEIARAMQNDLISYEEACVFANKVTDRFKNPFLEHKWLSISVNYTSKMRMRNIPLLQQHYSKTGKIPLQMAFGFAAYIVWMNCRQGKDKLFYHKSGEQALLVEDESAGFYAGQWEMGDIDTMVSNILGNKDLWSADLDLLPGFAQVIKDNIRLIQKEGVVQAMNTGLLRKTMA